VDPWVDEVLGHHHLRAGEHLVGAGPVARLPVEDVVVGLVLQIVADDRGAGLQGPAGVDHGGEGLVLDVDQLQGVPAGVAVVGYDEGHLLALEPDLVGGQHRQHVVGQGGDPGQLEGLQGGAGDHGAHLGVGLGGGGVDGDDAGVGVGAAEDGAVQHPGELDVVDVAAPAPDEAGVLLAGHPAEADRGPGLLDGAHAVTSSAAGCSAAHRMARTMFS
jgi:hypothetical protein